MSSYTVIAYTSWLVMSLVWLVGYFTAKRTAKRPDRPRQIFAHLFLVAGSLLVFYAPYLGFALGLPVMPGRAVLGPIGAGLDIAGIAFAIWARLVLGSNWSNLMTVKEDHQLIQTGPYAIVRHPIYTGLLLAALGTAMTIGLPAAYLGVLSFLVGLLIRIHSEDKVMAEQFPQTHPAYRARTKRLIPWVW